MEYLFELHACLTINLFFDLQTMCLTEELHIHMQIQHKSLRTYRPTIQRTCNRIDMKLVNLQQLLSILNFFKSKFQCHRKFSFQKCCQSYSPFFYFFVFLGVFQVEIDFVILPKILSAVWSSFGHVMIYSARVRFGLRFPY